MEFKCSACDYTSPYKIALDKHVNKKNKCGENPIVISVPIDIICEYCNKQYKSKDNLAQHLKICKVKKSNFEEENRILKRQLDEANRKLSSININSNNTNNTINNNITIQLRPYNDPRLPDDMDDIYEDAWEKQRSIPTYIERVHFSEDYPENHNLCITNLRSRLAAKVFNGTHWETKDQEQFQSLDKWVKISKKRIERYKDSIDLVDKDMKRDVKMLLYDSYKNGLVDIKTGKQAIKNDDYLD
jgi:hypothetical protein